MADAPLPNGGSLPISWPRVPLPKTIMIGERSTSTSTVVSENVQIPEGVDPDSGLNTAIYGADQVWPETWIEAATPVVDGNYKAVQVVINLARVNPNPSSQAIPPQTFVETLQFAQLHVDFEVANGRCRRRPVGGATIKTYFQLYIT